MGTPKTCPHGKEAHVHLSGTQVRDMLRKCLLPPPEFTREELGRILIESLATADAGAGGK